jgi:hypothetical protein
MNKAGCTNSSYFSTFSVSSCGGVSVRVVVVFVVVVDCKASLENFLQRVGTLRPIENPTMPATKIATMVRGNEMVRVDTRCFSGTPVLRPVADNTMVGSGAMMVMIAIIFKTYVQQPLTTVFGSFLELLIKSHYLQDPE